MNRWEKEVLQSLLASEADALKELEDQYKQALADINRKVRDFQAEIDLLDAVLNQDGMDDTTKARLRSRKQSKIYQQQYQEALQGQVSGILDKLHGDSYSTVEQFMRDSYENGYVGTMYDIAKQGIPVIMPIDQKAVVRAVLADSKVSGGLYARLGVDIDKLKKSITQEISRGIATDMSYNDIARNIANVSKAPLYRAKTIARTESHRIQLTSTADAQQIAKDRGADVVKQWDATLDRRTRPSHQRVDGEIREIDEKFSNGLMYPGDPAGGASEVVNCRCAMLTRARWALDEDELKTLQDRAKFYGLDKTENFEDFKKKYIAAGKEVEYNNNVTSDSSVFDGIISKQTGMNQSYQDVLNKRYSNGKTEAKKAFNKYVPSDSVVDSAYTGTAHFSPTTQKISMNFADDLTNKRGAGATFFHEHGHFIDFMAAGSANYDYMSVTDQAFGNLLQTDFKDYVKAYKKQHNMKAADAYRAISFELMGHEKHSLSDLLDGISKGKCSGMYGHPRNYWTRPGALEKEAFAHMFEASFDSNKYALMKQYFPNALAEFESLLKGMI